MLGGSSSDEKKSDNESDYDASESSDDPDGDDVDVDLVNKEKSTMITTRRKSKDDSVIISISETAKLRKRKSGISISSIQEPIVVPNLVGPLMKRKRDSVRLPTKRFEDRIVGSSSSSSSSSSSIPTQVNVNGGTNTTTSSSSQDSIFGSSLGSNNPRASSVNPNSLLSESSSSSSVHAQPYQQQQQQQQLQPSSSSVVSLPQHYLASQATSMQRSYGLRQQRQYVPILPRDPDAVPRYTQANISRMAPQASAMQRPYGWRQQPQLLPTPQASGNNPNPNAYQGYTQAQMEAVTRTWQSLLWNLHGPSFQGNFTRPSSVNIHRPVSVCGPIPSATLSDVLGSSSSSSLEAQANAIRGCNSGLLPAMPNDQQQQQHYPNSSMDMRGLDLNLPANNEDGGFDLNQPAARDE